MFNTNWIRDLVFMFSAVKTHYVATVVPVTEEKRQSSRVLRRVSCQRINDPKQKCYTVVLLTLY